jgi:hypothetical protein
MANDVYGKEKSEKMNTFAKGGSTKMFKQGGADAAQPGVSINKSMGGDQKFNVQTGGGKMFAKMAADPQESGVAGHSAGNSQKWGLAPSKGHMAPFTPARNQTPA